MDSLRISKTEGTVLVFGPFRLYPDQQLLLRGETPVKLGGRGFDLLNLLVQRRGELVTKRELIASTWPDIFVHESNLKVNMFSLRKALYEETGQSNYIVTVPGRGYRFVASVTTSTDTRSLSAKSAQHRHLPPPRDIIGRATEISAIVEKLRDNAHVTIVGAGGVGKTTLAVAAAHACQESFPDGVCWVDLSVIDDPMLVHVTVAAALGIRGNVSEALDAVVDYLNQRRMLVLLDNCEHVLPTATVFSGRLTAAGRSRLLATSRTPLATAGEHVFWLDPLEYPPVEENTTSKSATQYPAVQLLTQRAFEATGYTFVDEDSAALISICQSLDGIPLAIELAAGKLGQHGPRELLSMLNVHLAVLERGKIEAPRRHQALIATIDWSYRLLTNEEAAIFQAISIFAGTFGSADVVAIAAGLELGATMVAATLGALVAKSLVVAKTGRQDIHYRLLDTTRRYALDQLRQHPLYPKVCRAHAERMVEIFEQSEREWDWREGNEWSASYQDRLPDLRKALAWTFEEGSDPELGVRLTIAAIPVLFKISSISEVGQRAEEALRHPASDLQRMKLAGSRAWSMIYGAQRQSAAEDAWRDAIEFARQAGDVDYQLRALLGYAFHLNGSGRVDLALECLKQFQALAASNPHSPTAVDGERAFAFISGYRGDLVEAQQILDRLVLTTPNLGQRSRMAGFQVDRYIGTRTYLSFVSWLTGRPLYAARVAEEGIRAAGQIGHLISQSNVLAISALPISFWNGDTDALQAYTTQLKENLEIETTELWKRPLRFYVELLAELRGELANIDSMLDVVEELIESRFTIRVGFYLGAIAEILTARGRLDEAHTQLDRAFVYQQRQNERWCLSELLRVKAATLARAGDPAGVVDVLEAARREARSTGALSFELRIATDLAHIAIKADQHERAIRTLEPVLARFADGLVTRDLQAAAGALERANLLRRH